MDDRIVVSEVNSSMVLPERHILLFVDNATSHRMNTDDSNIRILIIPTNCTSVSQPMDQGVGYVAQKICSTNNCRLPACPIFKFNQFQFKIKKGDSLLEKRGREVFIFIT